MGATIKTTLQADGKQYVSEFKKAGAAVVAFKDNVKRSLGAAAKAFGSLGTVVGALGLAKLGGQLAGVAGEFDRIGKLANRFDLPVEDIQRFSVAAELSGANLEVLAAGIQKATRSGSDAAHGSQAMAESFAVLNVEVGAFNAATPDQKLKLIADGFNRTKDEGEAMAALLKVLGRSGGELIPLLREGGDGIGRLTEGLTLLSKTEVDGIQNFNDQITILKANLKVDMAKQFAGSLDDIKGVVMSLISGVLSLSKVVLEYRKALMGVVGAMIAYKSVKFVWEVGASIITLGKALVAIGKQVFAYRAAGAALDAETKSLGANTWAQMANAKAAGASAVARRPGGGRHNSKLEAKALGGAVKMKLPGGGRHAKKMGADAAGRFLAGFKSKLVGIGSVLGKVLAATVTGATVLVGAAAAAVAVGVAVWAKHQEKVSEGTLRTHEALNDVATASWEAVNAAKTAEETEAARADIAKQILDLKKQAGEEGNAERKAAIETQVASLELVSARADEFRLRNLSADAAEKAAAQAKLEQENAEFAARLEAERVENAVKLAELAKERAETIAKGNAEMRAELGMKLFDRKGVDEQLGILKAGVDRMMREVNSSQDITERMAGRGGAKLQDLDAIKRAADAARGRGDVGQEKVLLEYLQSIFAAKEKIYDIEKAQAETKADQTEAIGDFALEGRILEARAAGNDALVASLERQQAIEAMKLELMHSQGLEAGAALIAARKRVDLEKAAGEAAEKAADAKRRGDAGRDFAGELAVLKLRAGGRDGPADALAKEIESRKDAVRLAEDMGISEKEALNLVRERDALQRRIDGRKNSTERKRSGIYKLTAAESAARRRERGGGIGFRRERTVGLRPASFDREARSRDSAGKDRAVAESYYERSIGVQEEMVGIFKKLGVMA